MKLKRLIILALTFFIISLLLSTASVNAQTPQPPSPAIIESYVIENVDGTDVTNGPLMAGATYTVSLTINSGVNLANNTLILTTPMNKVGDVFWHLKNEYEGIDTNLWQPGQASIEFDVAVGIAELTLTAAVPSDYTSEKLSNDEYLHFLMPISLVELSLGPTGTILDECTVDVLDQAIVAYQQTKSDKRSILQSATTDPNDADPKYMLIAEEVFSAAEALSSSGYVEQAKSLLDILPVSTAEFPMVFETFDEADESSNTLYVIIIVVIGVILLALLILFFRVRSSGGYIRQQVDEEAGRLDVLSVRVARMDKQLASDLDQVKEQLERISGR